MPSVPAGGQSVRTKNDPLSPTCGLSCCVASGQNGKAASSSCWGQSVRTKNDQLSPTCGLSYCVALPGLGALWGPESQKNRIAYAGDCTESMHHNIKRMLAYGRLSIETVQKRSSACEDSCVVLHKLPQQARIWIATLAACEDSSACVHVLCCISFHNRHEFGSLL